MPVHMTYKPSAPTATKPPPHGAWKAGRVTLLETENLTAHHIPKGAIVYEIEGQVCCEDDNTGQRVMLDPDTDLFIIVEPG